ncbi:MAG: peptidase M61, partial [Novosphingobium sp.]
MERMQIGLTVAALMLGVATPARPQQLRIATPLTAQVPEAADTPYPGGTITLDVDASDTTRGLFRVAETIPLAPGARSITLLYPQWLPGTHAPRGPINLIGDLKFSVGGKSVAWTRDPIEVYAFRVALPEGARELVARFIHTAPLEPAQGRISMTAEMLNLQWEKVSLYPAGHYVRRIRIKPSAVFPQGWTAASALNGMKLARRRVDWDETDYETLVDSPIFAGLNFKSWDLGHAVNMPVVADAPEQLVLRVQDLARLRSMVEQGLAVFGAPPFDHYALLVALTARMGAIGLEHQRSSENSLDPRSFADWDANDWDRNVLAHELSHAWNGKFRRPAGLWTPDYRQPMQNDLLWVYEGQTQFWGYVLAARSGLQTKQTVLDMIARNAAGLAEQAGRDWRSIADTTYDPIIGARRPRPHGSLTRGEDYYAEGALVWLEADQIIRDGTGGARGLDDFARAFFAYPGGGPRQKTYTRDDLITALNAIHPYDWRAFFATRIDQPGLAAPLAGIEKAGYRLVWKDRPNAY